MYLKSYLGKLENEGKYELAMAANKTASYVRQNCIRNFSYTDHRMGLLFGNVQSGKTSHMFSIISMMADEGFKIFLLLTTDNVYLQKQTLERARAELPCFNVCDENGFIDFVSNTAEPAIIVVKKNARVLGSWLRDLQSSMRCTGNTLAIFDDEGDAASLNTMVNKGAKSTIHSNLNAIRTLSTSSIYFQITATPQALLLQTQESGWSPEFVYYFEPGRGYLGGNFFFNKQALGKNTILTDDDELEDILNDDEYAFNGLWEALIHFLLCSANAKLSKGYNVANFLIHPSFRIADHGRTAEKIGDYLNTLSSQLIEENCQDAFVEEYGRLKARDKDFIGFKEALAFITSTLEQGALSIKVVNSKTKVQRFDHGINIIIGGNSLGRGLTIPKLYTVYYARSSRYPQADTVWQHARIFGYDRDRLLIKLFLPPSLYQVFSHLNETNNALIAQIRANKLGNLRLYYASNIKPTRKEVVDSNSLFTVRGGANYFPNLPTNKSTRELDCILKNFSEKQDYYMVDLRLLLSILNMVGSEHKEDWDVRAHKDFASIIAMKEPGVQAVLIVRRNRDIAKGTGTLLSPRDRNLGDKFDNNVVLTLYRITGTKGWNGQRLWIPNIKFPNSLIYYGIRS